MILEYFVDYLVASFVLWVLFVLGIQIKNKYERGDIKGLWKVPAYLYVIVFLILDVQYRIIWGSVGFGVVPKFETMTSLLKRYYKTGGYRGWLAGLYCKYLLHPFDDGHCE